MVTAGPFVMGDHDGQYDEKPVRLVTLATFEIQRTEVSMKAYMQCVEAGVCAKPRDVSSPPRHPVTGVRWDDARRYCMWRGWRLPTEAQWEKAARGVDQRRFPWGGDDARGGVGRANCAEGCTKGAPGNVRRDRTNLVDVDANSDGASPYGALNMAGNAEEWVADWYGEGYNYDAPKQEPKGPEKGVYRSVRGGEHTQELSVTRTTNRYWAKPDTYNSRRGFRCAR